MQKTKHKWETVFWPIGTKLELPENSPHNDTDAIIVVRGYHKCGRKCNCCSSHGISIRTQFGEYCIKVSGRLLWKPVIPDEHIETIEKEQ